MRLLVHLALALAGATGGTPASPHGVVGPRVEQAVARHGSAYVVVAFRAPHALRTLSSTRTTVRAVRGRVLARAGSGFRPTTHWDAVLGVAGRVNAAGLKRLAADREVRRIDLDVGGRAMDVQQNALIHATEAQQAGYTGNGVTAAVLDSGIQEDHPDLADSLVSEHCITPPSGCPNHQSTQNGSGSAHDDNGHGTNVAGIITSNGTIAPIGVAPSTKIVAVKVLAADGSFQSTSDIVSALQWVLNNTPSAKVINMSLGTNQLFTGTCDNSSSFTMTFASIVHSLRLNGVTIFASSGNQ